MRTLLTGLLPALCLLSVGCGVKKHQLNVQTRSAGAQVFLKRTGEKIMRVGISKASGTLRPEKWEGKFALIGTTPLLHSFPREERRQGANIGSIGARRVIKYTGGVLRIEKAGHKTIGNFYGLPFGFF